MLILHLKLKGDSLFDQGYGTEPVYGENAICKTNDGLQAPHTAFPVQKFISRLIYSLFRKACNPVV